MKRAIGLMMAVLLLAGCWQTTIRPYRNVTGVTPFAAGIVTITGPGMRGGRYRLTLQPQGRYRLAAVGRGEALGDGFDLALFPLPHAPSHVLIYEAVPLDHPREMDDVRYYGLLNVTGPASAQEMRPDCGRDARAARASGTRRGADGNCTFASRDALEKSLLALWKRRGGTPYRYRLTPRT